MAVTPLKDRPFGKRVAAYLVYGVARGVTAGLRRLSFDQASNLGAWVAGGVAPFLTSLNKRALKNLQAAFPEKSEADLKAIMAHMWQNFGRSVFEFMVLDKVSAVQDTQRFILEIAPLPPEAAQQGCLFFAGHIGNWELIPKLATEQGMDPVVVYREANNPLVDQLIQDNRARYGLTGMVPKGAEGARALLKALKQNRTIGMLVDQKMNDGIAVPFFGRQAMTAPALAQFALKQDRWVVPTRVVRLDGTRFRIVFEPAFKFASTGDMKADKLAAMTQVNAILERWIREYPDQWFWMHNRWPKS